MAILDMIGNQLQGDTLRQMSQQLGTDETTTAKAVSVALPLLLGGLTRNAATPQGAASLDAALTRDHDGSLLDQPQRALTDPSAFKASGILGHIFGQRQAPVQQGVAKATGLDSQRVGQLLMMLAPIVMAALARARTTQGSANASAGQVLQHEQSNIERQVPGLGGLASILDRDGDGQIADDIASLAAGRLGGLGGTGGGGLGGLLGGLLGGDRR
ncbi:MAG: calcium-binding protein [Geminicoccaceae bacterium]|jgi:hypothetical protein|nr:calcium-binding protein [Geminicoccaceae bacterium]